MLASNITIVVSPAEVDIIKYYIPQSQPVLLSNVYHVPVDSVIDHMDWARRQGALFVGASHFVQISANLTGGMLLSGIATAPFLVALQAI